MKQLIFIFSLVFILPVIGQEIYIDVQKVFRTTEVQSESERSNETHKALDDKEYIIIFAKLQTINNDRLTIKRNDVFLENEVGKYGLIGMLKMETMQLNPKTFSFSVQDREVWKAFVFYLDKGTKAANFIIGTKTAAITKIEDENPLKLVQPTLKIQDLQILDSLEKQADYSRKKGMRYTQKISSKNGKLLSMMITISADSLPPYQSTVFVKSEHFYLLNKDGLKIQPIGASLLKNMVIPDFSVKFTNAEEGLTAYIYIAFEIGKLTMKDLKDYEIHFGGSFAKLIE